MRWTAQRSDQATAVDRALVQSFHHVAEVRRAHRLYPGRQRAGRGPQTGRKGPGMIANVKARYADGVLTRWSRST